MKNNGLWKTLVTMTAIMAMSLGLTSCDEDEDVETCSDDFLSSYQDMQSKFDAVYSSSAGSTELEALRSSLSSFLASHSDVECDDADGNSYAPTSEVTSFYNALPEYYGASVASVASSSKTKLVAKVVYGEDNRVDVGDAPETYQNWATSTAAQMSYDEWDSDFNLTAESLGEAYTMCPDEEFYDQLTSARCSGFLVAPDLMVTAGHCVTDDNDCANYAWVFDYKDGATSIKEENIYECAEIVAQDYDDSLDYAVIRLNKEVEGRKFFRSRTSGTVDEGTSLVVIGHPTGLPTKVADGAEVWDNSPADYFTANLDTFGGNSGSAVINSSNGVVEGILVRGEQDYNVITWTDGSRCRQTNYCDASTCDGEEVTKMTSVSGITVIGDYDEVYAGLYTDKDFPEITQGLPISFLGYSYGDYTLGGVKFLDHCGVHYYKTEDSSSWSGSFVGSCDNSEVANVISNFSDLFYF